MRGASNEPLKRITAEGRIFDAWEDEPWVVEGAAVRVSIVCFEKSGEGGNLNGSPVPRINADLSPALELSRAVPLAQSAVGFIGDQKTGPFEIEGDLARQWLMLPLNPNGR